MVIFHIVMLNYQRIPSQLRIFQGAQRTLVDLASGDKPQDAPTQGAPVRLMEETKAQK